MTNLALFDIDGTLLESNEFDIECFVDAVKQVLGLDRINEDWSQYNNITDVGILSEIYQSNFGKEIVTEILEEVEKRFTQTIRNKFQSGDMVLDPLPGAHEAVEILMSADDWAVALATGGWKNAANLKLNKAKMNLDGVPMFSSNNAISRPEILKIAMESMQAGTGVDRFQKVVCIGDGIWDLRAAREVGIAFLGVGRSTKKLIAEGASHVIEDYADIDKFLESLNDCC
jgi:phosphoglycolate phosphatase-like HAD superfamily hydrolase